MTVFMAFLASARFVVARPFADQPPRRGEGSVALMGVPQRNCAPRARVYPPNWKTPASA
jgi:hypothetical protein